MSYDSHGIHPSEVQITWNTELPWCYHLQCHSARRLDHTGMGILDKVASVRSLKSQRIVAFSTWSTQNRSRTVATQRQCGQHNLLRLSTRLPEVCGSQSLNCKSWMNLTTSPWYWRNIRVRANVHVLVLMHNPRQSVMELPGIYLSLSPGDGDSRSLRRPSDSSKPPPTTNEASTDVADQKQNTSVEKCCNWRINS